MIILTNITLVKWQEFIDYFRCIVADVSHKQHTVEMPKSILGIAPEKFQRGSDSQHVGIIAAGTVLLNIDPEVRFHKADRSMVERAYDAASKAQILGSFEHN